MKGFPVTVGGWRPRRLVLCLGGGARRGDHSSIFFLYVVFLVSKSRVLLWTW